MAYKIIIYCLIFIASFSKCFSQSIEEFEEKISTLLSSATGYKNIEKIIFLIEWESDIVNKIPCISPLQSPDFRNINISSGYGYRYHPITGEYKHHSGIDIPGEKGDSVYAAASGIIHDVGYDNIIGNYIKIKHDYGFETIYGHLDRAYISMEDSVKLGQLIGFVGNTGRSSGPHLHYSVKKNNQLENAHPYCFLLLKRLLESKSN